MDKERLSLENLHKHQLKRIIREYNAMKRFVLSAEKELPQCTERLRASYELMLEQLGVV